MKRSLSCCVMLMAVVFILAGRPAGGEALPLFGPERFERQRGAPVAEQRVFASTVTGGGFVLTLANGDSRGKHRVTSGKIWVNGQEIAGPNDFSRQIEGFDRDVSLSLHNVIETTLMGQPGSFVVITILPVANRAPSALDDEAITDEGKAVTISVLANDSDPDGDPLTLVSVTQASQGGVVLNPEGTVTYTPVDAFVGTDHFTYEVSDGHGGSARASVTVSVRTLPKLTLQIISPQEGQRLSFPKIEVRGTVHNPWGLETGAIIGTPATLVIGGKPAVVSEGLFLAHGVPLVRGENIITVTATDIEGNTASATVAVESSWDLLKPLNISAMDSTGVAPFDTLLSIDTNTFYSTPALSWTGPGEVEILPGNDPEHRKVRIHQEGFYQITVQATHRDGEVHEDSVSILVLNRTQLNGLLQTKWAAMREQLQRGEVEEALGYFVDSSKERYRVIFGSLGSKVASIVAGMQDIEMINCRDKSAEYRINRQHWIDGQPVTITYSVYFRVDRDGFWKIDRF